jgi:hypothetical protein
MRLIDERTADGSRHFSRLPGGADWGEVCDHALRLPGVEIAGFVRSELADAWLDFSFRGHRFRVRSRQGRLHLFVDDPQCSDLILYQVGRHFERLMTSEKDQPMKDEG